MKGIVILLSLSANYFLILTPLSILSLTLNLSPRFPHLHQNKVLTLYSKNKPLMWTKEKKILKCTKDLPFLFCDLKKNKRREKKKKQMFTETNMNRKNIYFF